jgi:hypothetical protein
VSDIDRLTLVLILNLGVILYHLGRIASSLEAKAESQPETSTVTRKEGR